MTRILLTAFEAYEPWKSNASWLGLVDLTRNIPPELDVTTRLYPVDLAAMKDRLATDLKTKYDLVFHVGQAPFTSCIQLEEIAVNVATRGRTPRDAEVAACVCDSGPTAYRSKLPLRAYAKALREAGIPARVSFSAGTYLCNAIFYWSCRLADDLDLATKSTFIHVPLDTSQVVDLDEPTPFMPSAMTATALQLLLKLAAHPTPDAVA